MECHIVKAFNMPERRECENCGGTETEGMHTYSYAELDWRLCDFCYNFLDFRSKESQNLAALGHVLLRAIKELRGGCAEGITRT